MFRVKRGFSGVVSQFQEKILCLTALGRFLADPAAIFPRVDQQDNVLRRPEPIGHASRHRWRDLEALVNADEVAKQEV